MLVQKYDKDHDVLHIYFSERCTEQFSSAEEEAPGFFVLRDDDSNEITGVKILDIKKKLEGDYYG